MSLLNDLTSNVKFFQKETFTGPQGEPYMERYIVFGCDLFSRYIHKFIEADWTRLPHNHPRKFWSFILAGSYIEYCYEKKAGSYKIVENEYLPGDINFIGLDTIHRIVGVYEPCWTLCFGGRRKQGWGFFDTKIGRYIPYALYMEEVYGKGEKR
jgi:hypothetical protein